jgi:hypothetical protein
MTKEQLKKKYDGKGIDEIEGEIETSKSLSLDGQRGMIFALSYLKSSSRYKENPIYRSASFENYLKGMFNMRLNTFYERERAFVHYPKETEKYGVGLVAKVKRKCGAKKEKTVFNEIREAQKKLKTPIKADQIETIIKKNSPPPKGKPIFIDYKAKYFREEEAHRETKKQLVEARTQIEKLKATVLELRPLRDMADIIAPFIIPRDKIESRVS